MKGFAVVKPPLPAELAAQVHQADADARQRFAADVDAILIEIRAYVDRLPADTFERLSRYEAWCDVHREVLERFTQPTRNLENALLRQLVREAHDALTNPETHVDVRDWTKAAAAFLERRTAARADGTCIVCTIRPASPDRKTCDRCRRSGSARRSAAKRPQKVDAVDRQVADPGTPSTRV